MSMVMASISQTVSHYHECSLAGLQECILVGSIELKQQEMDTFSWSCCVDFCHGEIFWSDILEGHIDDINLMISLWLLE